MQILHSTVVRWALLGLLGFAVFPWYAAEQGSALAGLIVESGLTHTVCFRHPWLGLVGVVLALIVSLESPGLLKVNRVRQGYVLLVLAALGLGLLLGQAFAIGLHGWKWAWLASLSPYAPTQGALGWGALLVGVSLLMILAGAIAQCGGFNHDTFLASCVVGISSLILVFTFYPVGGTLLAAVQNTEGLFSAASFFNRLFTEKIWGVGCLIGNGGCGVAWNTVLLAALSAAFATLLGLSFAFVVTRTGFRFKKALRLLTVLPIITPPFVIGLGLILIFGRSGLVNQFLDFAFDIQPSRWIYGLKGVLLAQVFAFTPIAFLVLIGVVEGVSPSMEEAAQTLRANRWQVFRDVSLPLMLPGIANAFLVVFIESIADFGNPIVLGGNYGVLSTEIFFSIVGAQLDQGRAAALAIILLGLGLAIFALQRWVLGRKVYTSMSGKGDNGLHATLPAPVRKAAFAVAMPWAILTVVVYTMATVGGFVETWGRDYTPTLRHYAKAFSISSGEHGLLWTGEAWNSLWTTLELAALASPLTAMVGIMTAYVLTRHNFRGRSVFEFGTMLSYAVPGTVIGVAYVLAFNVPPVELTGTAAIIVLCFVFRNMSVGVRAGIAAMSQIDKNLDEASTTLGAGGLRTLTSVILPLLKPALIAALVYSFVRAMTTVSAIIFLVSPEHELATVYIINRVINSDYGVAIAYSSTLIVLMVVVIGIIRFLVGERKVGRRSERTAPAAAPATAAT